ncbi:hypothetical protein PZA11_004934 [Diplocarpon coronariae]
MQEARELPVEARGPGSTWLTWAQLGIFQALERDIESKLAAAEISPRDLQLLESLPAVVPIKQKMIVLLGRGGTPCPGGDNFVRPNPPAHDESSSDAGSRRQTRADIPGDPG